jgi:hypothetical protein
LYTVCTDSLNKKDHFRKKSQKKKKTPTSNHSVKEIFGGECVDHEAVYTRVDIMGTIFCLLLFLFFFSVSFLFFFPPL